MIATAIALRSPHRPPRSRLPRLDPQPSDRVTSLAPDLHAPLTFAAYRAGRDLSMEAIAKEVGAK